MGRPPLGKQAMSGADRTRRYREKLRHSRPVTKPTMPDTGLLKTRIRELEAQVQDLQAELAMKQSAQDGAAENAMLRARIEQLAGEMEPLRKEAANAHALYLAATDFLDTKARMIPYDIFQTLRQSSHPDRVTSPKAKARYQEAFVFLEENEKTLAKRKPPPKPPGLPSRAELDAARWHKREQRRASARKAAESRQAKKTPRKALKG